MDNGMNRRAAIGTLIAGAGAGALAQTPAASPAPPAGQADPIEWIDLWPGKAPGMPARPPAEAIEERSTTPGIGDRSMTHIARPRMAVFRAAVPNGAAALVMPGGGYSRIVIDKEGYEIGRWLAARGVTVFVLFYRLPGDGWAAGPDVALSDAQRAMRLIRHRAATWGLATDRIAAMGFSAGGHVCGDLATRFDADSYKLLDAADRLSARPDLAAPIYAVQSMQAPVAHAGSRTQLIGADAPAERERAHSPAANLTARTPPLFMVHAEDDATVPVENTLEMRAAARRAGVPVQTHLFTHGGHGFGLRGAAGKPAEKWPGLFYDWARSMRLI